MTGHEIRDLRLALGLSATQLRDVIGVNANTVARWESAADDDVSLDPRNRELLDVIAQLVAKRTPEQATALGRRIRGALAKHGGLYALHRVLAVAYVHEFDQTAVA